MLKCLMVGRAQGLAHTAHTLFWRDTASIDTTAVEWNGGGEAAKFVLQLMPYDHCQEDRRVNETMRHRVAMESWGGGGGGFS